MMRFFLIAVCWLCIVGFSLHRLSHPPAASSATPASGAAFAIAVDHLNLIAAEKHPVGTAAHARVRDYIQAQIAGLGLAVEVQTVPVAELTGEPQWAAGGAVSNVITRIEGRQSGRAVLVAGHYDSYPTSYGAGDDGAAIASMLALLEMYSETATPLNDIIFLFTDGEEPCLCGARAFVSEHPWADEVGVVINFEGRGTAGTSALFETSTGNGALVGLYAEAVRHPVASSLYYEIYKVLPNNTDFTVFRVAGLPGFNFAFVDGYRYYHTANDTAANLDRNTFFHQFTNMETMLRQLAASDLEALAGPDVVFFDVLSFFVVRYTPAMALLFAILCAALFGSLVVTEVRRQGRRNSLKLLLSLPAWLLLCTAIVLLAAFLAGTGMPDITESASREMATSKFRMLVLAGLTTGLVAGALHLAGRVFSRQQLALPIAGLWLLLLGVVLFVAPGASHLFTWPLLFLLLGMRLDPLVRRDGIPGGWQLFCAVVMPLPLLVIWSQLVYAVFIALSLHAAVVLAALLVSGMSLLSFYLMPALCRGASAP